jgi:hypothetical protein
MGEKALLFKPDAEDTFCIARTLYSATVYTLQMLSGVQESQVQVFALKGGYPIFRSQSVSKCDP